MNSANHENRSGPLRVAHIFVSNVETNSGDFLIGLATKEYFREKILKTRRKLLFTNFNCRESELYSKEQISELNEYDFIIVGGGGLILPDSAPNEISCWQWVIPLENYELITAPIYVISIGYNLFYGQTIGMPSRESMVEETSRLQIFQDNIAELIERATHFSMRHEGDRLKLVELLGANFENKIQFELCPTIWFVEKYWKPRLQQDQQKYIAIEIKDDRPWRRYYKIGKEHYYEELLRFVQWCIETDRKILYLSHDGSKDFFRYLTSKNINIPFLDNSCANAELILQNYSKIHTLLCSAGHSQMISHALGIRVVSLVSHPKLRYFCEDIGNHEFIEINQANNVCSLLREFIETAPGG